MYRLISTGVLFVFLLHASGAGGQDTTHALVRGSVINDGSETVVNGLQVSLPKARQSTTVDEQGMFSFSGIVYGKYDLIITTDTGWDDTIRILVNKPVVDLGVIAIQRPLHRQQQMPLPLIDPDINIHDGDEERNSMVNSLLTAGNDAFQRAAAFSWSPYWFRPRGYEKSQQQMILSGIPMNDAATGAIPWAVWGGLNDVFRSRTNTYGLQPAGTCFGGINGSVYIDAGALAQVRQTRFTYSLSNRQYRHRWMLTHSSGPLKTGWAWSFSASRRWAKEGYAQGTFYDAYALYAAVSKKIKEAHSFNITAFGSATKRGKQGPSYREAFEITGDNYYNPAWGFQNGEKRNARVSDVFHPVVILNYAYNPAVNTSWNTAISYQTGKTASSSLDWYNAADPRPDYYRYLPNFYLQTDNPDPEAAEASRAAFAASPQIKWDELYEANRLNVQPVPMTNRSPGADSGRRSVYVLGNDVQYLNKWSFATNLQRVIDKHVTIAAGLTYIRQQTSNYRELADLLGGDYYLNINAFAERNVAGTTILNQNDLNHPYQVIREGDRYMYNYLFRYSEAGGWGQAALSYNKVDLFITARLGSVIFQREGLYRNGIFSAGNASFGKGLEQKFMTYGVKGGATWKISGRNYFFVNGAMLTDAPGFDQVYFAARTRNATIKDPRTRKSWSLEAGYLRRSPGLNIRAAGYVTDMKDMVDQQLFYYQGTGSANTMVHYVLQDIAARFIGAELALEYKLTPAVSLTGAAALGQAFYTNNPRATIYQENTPDTIPRSENVYVKNYYLAAGPQGIYTCGVSYRSPKFWYGTLSCNYLDRNYIDIAASRRTLQTTELVTPGSPEWQQIVEQERFPAAYTLDVFFGRSFLLSKDLRQLPANTYLYLNVGVNNLLDNRTVISGGFENPRFDYSGGYAQRFGSRYYYAMGRNYFVNLSLKF
jgi:hypothetical protein